MTEESVSRDEDIPQLKAVVVGDGAIGKTCLLISFAQNKFPREYVPTVFENLVKNVTISENNKSYTIAMELWDTEGQEAFDRIRPLSYRDTDIFLICFSVVSPDSFENLSNKWIPEIDSYRKNNDSKLLLVGLKSDLRANDKELKKLEELGQKPVELSEINEYKNEINADSYIECSALTGKNVKEVFELASKVCLPNITSESEENTTGCKCQIM